MRVSNEVQIAYRMLTRPLQGRGGGVDVHSGVTNMGINSLDAQDSIDCMFHRKKLNCARAKTEQVASAG